MDHISTDDARRGGVGSRRSRMRSEARSRRQVATTVPDHFRTPVWLERSFVLPLTEPEPLDVPEQRQHPVPQQQRRQQMSTRGSSAGSPKPAYVRPPSDDIDFGTVVRRADRSRSALRTAWLSTGLSGLVLIAFLLTTVPAIAVLAAACAVVAVSATVVRMRLMRAPVPRVTR